MSRSFQSLAHLRPLPLDFDVCYRALCSRDARFDGQFFTAVTSTGIYCRPICPAPTPKAAHVRFYACAAAAEADGFRACRRCRPEASPGSPDWNIRADLVARTLRLIAEGIIDTEGVAELGVGPLALARTRRAQTARLLIDETNLTLTEIAFASGFASLRQFNETMRATFGCPPSALRRRGRPENPGGGGLTVRLQYRPPFDAEALLAFLGQRALAGVEEVSAGRYRRTVALPRSTGIVELEPNRATQEIVMHLWLTDLRDVSLLVQRCRHLLDRGAERAQTVTKLLAVPGIGSWTAAYIALRALGDPDAFPATDLGLHHALEQGGCALSPCGLAARAEAWRPWRSYAVMHFWTSLTDQRETRLPS